MYSKYQALEANHNLKNDVFQKNAAIQKDHEQASSLSEFLKAGLAALILMVGLSVTVYFFFFFIVALSLGQFG